MNEETEGYGDQVAFDLESARWEIDGMCLIRSRSIPNLNNQCGRNFTYRKFIECGETQVSTQLLNLPKEADTYTALYELATRILDPVTDYFGMIRLTYGFCSSKLAKEIPGRIAPKLDQHASYEKNRNGKLICE